MIRDSLNVVLAQKLADLSGNVYNAWSYCEVAFIHKARLQLSNKRRWNYL